MAELHIRSLTRLGYSVLDGMGTTATSLWRDTLRLDLGFFEADAELI